MKKITLILLLAAALRLILLDKYPAGLNADEAAIGYNAYSLIETGKDEHSASWPLVFRSFDDFKPPLYFYLVLPFVKFLGLNVWAVRLPSAILGIASVYLIYLLVKELSNNKSLSLLSAALLAISPWHLHFSRGGWEVNASTFFILAGIYAFIRALKSPRYYYLFAFAFVASLYTYHSARVVAPMLGLSLFLLYRKDLLDSLRRKPISMILPLTVAVLLTAPLIIQMLSSAGQSRFSGVSVFSDQGPLWQALDLRRVHIDTLLPTLIHNRYVTYFLRLVQNYYSHYSPNFLFVSGDVIPRSMVPGFGQSLIIFAPFFYYGVINLLLKPTRQKLFLLSWLLIAPVASSLTYQSPHALRSQNMVIPMTIITAYGLHTVYQFIKDRINSTQIKIIGITSVVALLVSFGSYLFAYYYTYPRQQPVAWEYGFEQLAGKIKETESDYEHIVISDRYDQPYIIMAFFLKYPPETLQKELVLTSRDKFGFSTVRSFGKYEFRPIDYSVDSNFPNTLLVATEENVPTDKVIDEVDSPSGQPVFRLLKTD